jgi:hypothetical protein
MELKPDYCNSWGSWGEPCAFSKLPRGAFRPCELCKDGSKGWWPEHVKDMYKPDYYVDKDGNDFYAEDKNLDMNKLWEGPVFS